VPFCKRMKDVKGVSNSTQRSFWLHTVDTLGCVVEAEDLECTIRVTISESGCEDSFAAFRRVEL
jgi:hypothetical protein